MRLSAERRDDSSGKALAAKLGLKAGRNAPLFDAPPRLLAVFESIGFASMRLAGETPVPAGGLAIDDGHLFARQASRLATMIPLLRRRLAPVGMLWVSLPTRAAQIETDPTDAVVRAAGLAHGLVDVKVCAYSRRRSLSTIGRLFDCQRLR